MNKITGETSDGYHTFDELYAHRAALFALLTQIYPMYSWKSKRHSDGKLPFGNNEMFVVGIDFPNVGQITYHHKMDKWCWFGCQELERARPFDGHSSELAMTRLLQVAESIPDWRVFE